MREFTNPFVIKAPSLKAAHIEAKLSAYDDAPSVYTLSIVNNADGTATLTSPAAVCGGVYRLRLTSTDGKCCYSGLVYVAGCPPVKTVGKHDGNGGVTPPEPSCP